MLSLVVLSQFPPPIFPRSWARMSDDLGIASGIMTVLQLTKEVIQYLVEVKDANVDRQRVLNEITSAFGFLFLLKDKAERLRPQSDESLFNSLTALSTPNGPLEQFQVALERIANKVRPQKGLRKVCTALAWPYEKGEVNQLLCSIERQKSLFIVAFQNDHMYDDSACLSSLVALSPKPSRAMSNGSLRSSPKWELDRNVLSS